MAPTSHPAIVDVAARISQADGLIVATPGHKAAYSGVLKALLTSCRSVRWRARWYFRRNRGSLAHVLAIDYALRPVLTALAQHTWYRYFLSTPDHGAGQRRQCRCGAAAALDRVLATFLDTVATRASARVPTLAF